VSLLNKRELVPFVFILWQQRLLVQKAFVIGSVTGSNVTRISRSRRPSHLVRVKFDLFLCSLLLFQYASDCQYTDLNTHTHTDRHSSLLLADWIETVGRVDERNHVLDGGLDYRWH